MTRWQQFAARDNPFPPEPAPVCLDVEGTPVYPGEEIVEIEGDVYRYDDLSVDRLLTALGLAAHPAGKEGQDV